MKFLDKNNRLKKVKINSLRTTRSDKESRSKIQTKVRDALNEVCSGFTFYEEFPVIGTRMTLDFFCFELRIAIEVQGNQHLKYIPHFHGEDKLNFLKQLNRDKEKREFCERNSIALIQIYESDTITNEFVKNLIWSPTPKS